MDIPEYISIPLVLVIFIAILLLFAGLLYCCRWLGESRDRPVMDIGHDVEDGPLCSKQQQQQTFLSGKDETEISRFIQWNPKFYVYQKQAWLRLFRKGQESNQQ